MPLLLTHCVILDKILNLLGTQCPDLRVVLNDLKVLLALICHGSLILGTKIPATTSCVDLKILRLVQLPAIRAEAKQDTRFSSLIG